MKSIKNHLSLVIALVSILFSIQVFFIVDRSVTSYKQNLAKNYSLVVVSKKSLSSKKILKIDKLFSSFKEITTDSVIKRLNTGMSSKNVELLKLTLPKFYKLKLKSYPNPVEISKMTKELLKNKAIIKVENFSSNHDNTYKLLLLFKNVITVFSFSMLIVTTLLIFKELKIWQFKHNERMSIMALFGAPVWLRSAVLFRLAIVDALIASAISFLLFLYISSSKVVLEQFKYVGIDIVIFDPVSDFFTLVGISLFLSILLALLIVIGHKEEV